MQTFDFDEFQKDNYRIHDHTSRFKNMSITDAFMAVYPELNVHRVDVDVCDTSTGKFITCNIKEIKKSRTIIEAPGIKEQIILKQNLFNYKKPVFDEELVVKIIQNSGGVITVDCLAPLYDEWITKIKKDIDFVEGTQVEVIDLQLTRAGYTGKAIIDTISEFTGTTHYIDTFVPGSQITLNIERNFERWNGQNINALVVGVVDKPDNISLICSRKKYMQRDGNLFLKKAFDDIYSQGSKLDYEFQGTVTGIINTAKKCGVFIEIPEFSITGMINSTPASIVKYTPGESLYVELSDVTYSGELPYIVENGKLKTCNLKPTFKKI